MYVNVGRVKDAHGIKGEVFVRIISGETSWLDELPQVRLTSGSTIHTFDIERARRHKDGIVFQLKGVVDRNKAETFKGFNFDIPEELLVSDEGDPVFLREIMGFEILDEKLGSLGRIQEFSTNGRQDLLVLKYKEREVMIPFVKDFVLNLDFNLKQIRMNLPEGLVE